MTLDGKIIVKSTRYEMGITDLQMGYLPLCPTLCLKTYPSCVFSSTKDYFSYLITRPDESSSIPSCWRPNSVPDIPEEVEQSHWNSSARRSTRGELNFRIITEDSSTFL
jgi:hypothetical protein